MRDLVDTTEMYLRTIYELEEEGIPPLRARIAERLDQSGPTVSQTVARMERDGLVSVAKDRSLKLSEEGRALATAVMRKHRLAERLLTDVIGLPWEKVHYEACRWEHVMGDEVELRLIEVLNEFTTSPFGNPIPGLEELVKDGSDEQREAVQKALAARGDSKVYRATDFEDYGPVKVRLVSINEIIQVEHKVVAKFAKYGVRLGDEVTIEVNDDATTITNANGTFEVPDEIAHAISVETIK